MESDETIRKNSGVSNLRLVENLEEPDRCRFCGEDGVVPVKDMTTDKSHRCGNPYRIVCIACERHISMTSKSNWGEHDDRFILPVGDDTPIPVFGCPGCAELVEGQPDECPNCGMNYEW